MKGGSGSRNRFRKHWNGSGRERTTHKSTLRYSCWGGTPVSLSEEAGRGGPSQKFVLASSLKISGSEMIVVASIDTDGTDGPTDIAGGIVDGYTAERASQKGIYENLLDHNSSKVLTSLGDAIYTEPTGTNVINLYVTVII